jgi:phosphoribosylanthranilate isomerase
VRVKVCGITRLEDADLAADLGACAIGFVFWPKSPRFVDADRAKSIVRAMPPLVIPVGVFVDQPLDVVNQVAETVGLGAVQLHGHETPEYCSGIQRRVIRAIGLRETMDARLGDEWPPSITLLLDAYDPEKRGGTGRTVDWAVAAAVASKRPTILSGGLRPENVGAAISTVRPYAIDVSSGVEIRPGVKDPQRLRAFFQAVTEIAAGNGREASS